MLFQYFLYFTKSQNVKLYASNWDMMSVGMWKAENNRTGQGYNMKKIGQDRGRGWEKASLLDASAQIAPGLSSNVHPAVPRSENSSSASYTSISHTALPCVVLIQVLILSSLSPIPPESQICLWNVRPKHNPYPLGTGFS